MAVALLGTVLAVALPVLPAALLGGLRAPAARQVARQDFVGSAACAGCHAAQAAAWQGSDHAHAMAAATPETVLGDFSGITATDGPHRADFRRDGERFLARTEGADGSVAEFVVTETFGVDPLQQYLVLFPGGRRQALPWAWDTRPREAGGQRWYHLTPQEGAAPRPGDPLHWTGRDQTWNFMCAACHSTGLVRGYDAARDRYDTTWTEIAVGCESCHGRGAAHLAWARDGGPAGDPRKGLEVDLRDGSGGAWRFTEGEDARGIARWSGPPRALTTAQTEICAPCHARARPIVTDPPPGGRFLDTHAPTLLEAGLYHADGQIRGEVFEWGSFAQSRMARAGVACADCHDPHSARLRAEGNALCAQCHLPARFDTAAHTHHPEASAGAQCVACHMPAVTYMGVDARRDHGFRVPRPDIAAAIDAPDTCTTCHAGRSPGWAAEQVAAWFGTARRATPHPALAIAAARRGAPGADVGLAAVALDRAQPPILRATALSLLSPQAGEGGNSAAQAVGGTLRDPEPLVRAAALRALEGLHPRNRLHALASLRDPLRLLRIEAARALAPVPPQAIPEADRAAFARAWEELLASERVAAERPEAQVNIGGLLAAHGDPAGADAAYARALALDHDFLPALVNRANLEEERGRSEAAQALLRRAVTAHPADAEPHYALALLLVRLGRTPEALAPLAEAAALAPEMPRYAYAQALALNGLGRRAEAELVLRAVLGRNGQHRDSLLALASMRRDAGDPAEAERLAAAAVALNPADREAAALLIELRRRDVPPGIR